MKFDAREAIKAMALIQTGTLQGRIQGQQEAEQKANERFQQALSAVNLGYGREQDERQREGQYLQYLGGLKLDPASKAKLAGRASQFFGSPQTSRYGLESVAPYAPQGSLAGSIFQQSRTGASMSSLPSMPMSAPTGAAAPLLPAAAPVSAGGAAAAPPPPTPASPQMTGMQMNVMNRVAQFFPGGGMIAGALNQQQPGPMDAQSPPPSSTLPPGMGGAIMPGMEPQLQPRPGTNRTFHAPGIGDLTLEGIDPKKAELVMRQIDKARETSQKLNISDPNLRLAVDNVLTRFPNGIETPEDMEQAQGALDAWDRVMVGQGPAADQARRVRAGESYKSIEDRVKELSGMNPDAAAYELVDLRNEISKYGQRYPDERGLPAHLKASEQDIQSIDQYLQAGDAESLGRAQELAQIVTARIGGKITPAQEGARLNSALKFLSMMSLQELKNPNSVRAVFTKAGLTAWAAAPDELITSFGGARAEKMGQALIGEMSKWRTMSPALQRDLVDRLRVYSEMSGRPTKLSAKELNELDETTKRKILEDNRNFELRSMTADISRKQYELARERFAHTKAEAAKKGLLKGDDLKAGSVLSNLESQAKMAYNVYKDFLDGAGLLEGDFNLEHPTDGNEYEARKLYLQWRTAEERRNKFLEGKGVSIDALTKATKDRVPTLGRKPLPKPKVEPEPEKNLWERGKEAIKTAKDTYFPSGQQAPASGGSRINPINIPANFKGRDLTQARTQVDRDSQTLKTEGMILDQLGRRAQAGDLTVSETQEYNARINAYNAAIGTHKQNVDAFNAAAKRMGGVSGARATGARSTGRPDLSKMSDEEFQSVYAGAIKKKMAAPRR